MLIAGTIRNSVNLAALDSKWQQKKEQVGKNKKDKKENMTAEERQLQSLQEQADQIREGRKPAEIDLKLQSGGKLSPEEIEYLKKNNPQALKEYQEIQQERVSYKEQLKNCKSKEDVEKLKTTKMGQFMAAAKKIANDPYIPKAQKYKLMSKLLMKTSAVEKEHLKFLQTLQYAELPEDEEEAKRKKHQDEEIQPEETRDNPSPEISLDEETADALEEIRKMTDALSRTTDFSISSESNASTETSTGSTTANSSAGSPSAAGSNIDIKL